MRNCEVSDCTVSRRSARRCRADLHCRCTAASTYAWTRLFWFPFSDSDGFFVGRLLSCVALTFELLLRVPSRTFSSIARRTSYIIANHRAIRVIAVLSNNVLEAKLSCNLRTSFFKKVCFRKIVEDSWNALLYIYDVCIQELIKSEIKHESFLEIGKTSKNRESGGRLAIQWISDTIHFRDSRWFSRRFHNCSSRIPYVAIFPIFAFSSSRMK